MRTTLGEFLGIQRTPVNRIPVNKIVGWVEENDLNKLQSNSILNVNVYGVVTSGIWNGSVDATKVIAFLNKNTHYTIDTSAFATYGNDNRVYRKISIP